MSDSELIDLIPFLETLSKVDNVYTVLQNCNNPLNSLPLPGPPRPLPQVTNKPQHQNNNQQQANNQQQTQQNHESKDYSDHTTDGPS